MKYVTFRNLHGEIRAGWIEGSKVVDMHVLSGGTLPDNLLEFVQEHESLTATVEQIRQTIADKEVLEKSAGVYDPYQITLMAPIPAPPSFRDFFVFEEHVRNARKRRGLSVPEEWYNIPVFYFSNHHAIIGPNEKVEFPGKSKEWDYELEMACVIGKKGRNIPADEAEDYIFGYCILNDWSARDLQRQETSVGLGPAKGKDFATSIGPYLVTKDELAPYRSGDLFNLEMTATVNGRLLSKGNFNTARYSFGQMIERASDTATLHAGDLIGSGTVGTGCLLELGPEVHPWLKSGDKVSLSITGLGVLENEVK